MALVGFVAAIAAAFLLFGKKLIPSLLDTAGLSEENADRVEKERAEKNKSDSRP